MNALVGFWVVATLVALFGAIVAIFKALDLKGSVDLETNTRHHEVELAKKDHSALEKVSDTQTKRLNDHYSAIAGLRAESRRMRSELRQLTRTVEALAGSHGRQSNAIGELAKRILGVGPKKGIVRR